MTESTNKPDRDNKRASRLDIDNWKVLIVDDQKDNLQIASEALSFHGADVRTATNGIEGLDILKDYTPTLILTDLSMPEMNGWEMQKKLRADEVTSKIPVIALTAHVMDGDEQQVIDAGFDGYIPKPFSVVNIVLQIKAILKESDDGAS